MQIAGLQRTPEKEQDCHDQIGAADCTQEDNSTHPDQQLAGLHHWLRSQGDWPIFEPGQHSTEEISNAVIQANRLSEVASSCGSAELTNAMQQLIQLMMDVSNEQLIAAESSFKCKYTQALEFNAVAIDALHCHADLMQSGIQSFIKQRSEKINHLDTSAQTVQDLRARKNAHAHVAAVFGSAMARAGLAV